MIPRFDRVVSVGWLMDPSRIIIAVLLPPSGVYLKKGVGGQLLFNVFLTLWGYVPGIIHAVYIVTKR